MTVASVTMAGSSMSALLWTIRSSSWGGLGLRPGPASSGGERGRGVEKHMNYFFIIRLCIYFSKCLPWAYEMVLWITWCITENVFSQAVWETDRDRVLHFMPSLIFFNPFFGLLGINVCVCVVTTAIKSRCNNHPILIQVCMSIITDKSGAMW